MLTIKVYEPDGSQFVCEAESVRQTKESSGKTVVKYWLKDADFPMTIREGIVHVMNNNGKPVADYYLSGEEDTESAPSLETNPEIWNE